MINPIHSALLAMTMVIWLATGCATPALWDAAKPGATKPVPSDKITEEELQEKGIAYTKHDGYYMVKKTPLEMARDYALLGVGLPFAVAADGLIGVGVVLICYPVLILEAGAAATGSYVDRSHGGYRKSDTADEKYSDEENERFRMKIEMQKDK